MAHSKATHLMHIASGELSPHCFTVGYGGRKPADFLQLLEEYGVARVVDVRLRPDRASMGAYTLAKTPAKGIQRLLAERNIAVKLGNPFLGQEDWTLRYEQYFAFAGHFLVQRLLQVEPPFCLLCAEKDVLACHRRIIGEYLARAGWHVEHIEANKSAAAVSRIGGDRKMQGAVGLFANEQALTAIHGLGYKSEWITSAEEQQLVAAVDAAEWSTELERRVQHYGYRYTTNPVALTKVCVLAVYRIGFSL